MTNCELNEIFPGIVASIQTYGAFIRIPGSKQQGLVHKSQVSSVRIDDVGEVLNRGDKVWCKIVNIDDDGKIGLSMKFVNQGNGQDLDPNGVEFSRDERRRKTIVPRERKAIELQAVLNTTCSKCGTKGHLATHCFTTPDGKKYDLIPEIDDDDDDNVPNLPVTITESLNVKLNKDEKKSKTNKKKKKKSKHRYQSSDSSLDNSTSKEKKKKKKKKHSKEIKQRKRKRSESSSSSDDSIPVVRKKHSK